jgi:hypothetical protein
MLRDGVVVWDEFQKFIYGRGVYVHRSQSCVLKSFGSTRGRGENSRKAEEFSLLAHGFRKNIPLSNDKEIPLRNRSGKTKKRSVIPKIAVSPGLVEHLLDVINLSDLNNRDNS